MAASTGDSSEFVEYICGGAVDEDSSGTVVQFVGYGDEHR